MPSIRESIFVLVCWILLEKIKMIEEIFLDNEKIFYKITCKTKPR